MRRFLRKISAGRVTVFTAASAVFIWCGGCTTSPRSVGAGARLKAQNGAAWQKIAPGIERRVFQIAASSDDMAVTVSALRCAPERVHIASGKLLTASEWRRKMSAVAATNGGYFDPEGRSLGLRITENKRVNDLHPADWGVFFVEGKTARIVHTRDYKDLRDKGRTHRVLEAIQCGPRLVVAGKLTKLKPQWARRTALGIDRSGRVVLAVADGELSFRGWQNVWRDNLNCPNALNLDGGGSTQLSIKTEKTAREIGGSWPVPDAVCIR